MNIIEQAQADMQTILSNGNEFGTSITFVTPDGSQTITITGLAFKHSLKVNDYGEVVNTKNAIITISEDSLITYVTDASGNILTDSNGNKIMMLGSYPTRNSANEIDLLQHVVSWHDSNSVYKYVINETLPDESLGCIVCKLGFYRAS